MVNASELCKIIKTCVNSNVNEIRIGELYMAFGWKDKSIEPLGMVETKPAEQISHEAMLVEKQARLQDELENLKLTDPLAYERALAEGELGDVESP